MLALVNALFDLLSLIGRAGILVAVVAAALSWLGLLR